MQADVTSANIVGYSTQTTKEDGDFTAITPFFVSINNAGVIKLSEFTHKFERNDNIQIFNGAGDCVKALTYKRRGSAPNYEWYWQLEDYTLDPDDPEISEVADYSFDRGLSIWLSTKSANEFTQSGAINKDPVVYPIPGEGDFVQAGNCRAVDLKLSEIQFSKIDRNDNIQMFNGSGDCVKALTYKRRGSSPNYEWYWQLEDYSLDPDDPEVSEIDPEKYIFKPGEHFWFSLKNEGTATIPGITL